VAAAHAGVHLPLHWLLARCAVTDRRKLYALRLGTTSERFGARRMIAQWAGTPADFAGADEQTDLKVADSVVGASSPSSVSQLGDAPIAPDATPTGSRRHSKPLSVLHAAMAGPASAGTGGFRAGSRLPAPSVATHVRVRCRQTQRAGLAVGCAALVVMTAVAEVAAKPWCAAPTATFNAVLGIALAVDAVVAQPLFVLLVWVWRWMRGDAAPTAPYPIHGAWRMAGAPDAASASDFSPASSGFGKMSRGASAATPVAS